MFTGIIEEVGIVHRVAVDTVCGSLEIRANTVRENTRLGDSIAVNGVCLTVTGLLREGFTADVMAETMRCTTLGELKTGMKVNLERAMAANGRFGGHFVSGHIDGVGTVRAIRREGNAIWMTVCAPTAILRGIVRKGSIAIDGVSLTVASLESDCFSVSIIPHTGAQTILLGKRSGNRVNLENDLIGKYVQRFVEPVSEQKTNEITLDFLAGYGFS